MPGCIEWGKQRHKECTKKADKGYNECDKTEDKGYNKCTKKRDDGYRKCCKWWPCSWFCKAWVWISNIVCVAWTWVSKIVCVAWTWVSKIVCVAWTVITTAVCVLWDVVTTIVNAILTTLEGVLGWLLSVVAIFVELLQSIPVLGTLVRWVANLVTAAGGIVASAADTALGVLGIRPEKKLRVCTVILRDEKGLTTAPVDFAVTMLQLAADVYKRDANVRIVPLRPFHYTSGFTGAEKVDESWVQIDHKRSGAGVLDVPCHAAGAGADWLPTGSNLQLKMSRLCTFGTWRRVTGYGAPVTCFILRDIPGALGCALWITDYVTIKGEKGPPTRPRALAHEVGHACNLWHVCVDQDNRNLMATTNACQPSSKTPPDVADPRMKEWQALLVRASKHVTYF